LRSARTNESGFTLLETAVAVTVLGLGMLAAVTILDRGVAQSETSTALFLNEDRARGALGGLFDVVAEASILNVDTTMRNHSPNTASDVASDRFTIPGVTLRQCASPTCAFHTRQDLSVVTNRRHCGFEYCGGALGQPVTRGKNVSAALSACPFDGSDLNSTARLDGMKFFVARDESGAYTSNADGSPRWGGLVVIFPCGSADGLAELRRYDVHASDLVLGTPAASTGWSRFPKNSPTMIDLFDFGADGTTNGVPDGSVPLSNATSDASYESFTSATYQGSPVVLYTKALGTTTAGVTSYPARSLTLRIDLETGQTYFAVSHYDSATSYWTCSRSFTRTPRTLVRGLTELAISTQVSDPFHATTNPRGVSESNVVRITVGTSEAPRSERAEWTHHVDTFQVKARNN
jgi:hypothetical protein